jgi:hypothetical protein
VGSVRQSRTAGFRGRRSAWAFLAAAVLCAAAGVIINAIAGNPSRLSKRAVLEFGGSALVLWGVAVVLLIFAFARFSRASREGKQERHGATVREVAHEHLSRARRLLAQLLAGELPAVEQVWDVVLQPEERVLLDGSLGYSRFYGSGSPPTYTHVSTRHYGAVGVGQRLFDHAIDNAGNRAREEQAAHAASARWRDQQQSRVVVTDRRLLCEVKTHGWLSFDHKATKAIKAVPETSSVVLEYPGTAPVCLSGAASAQVMVVVVWALYGADGLREHPALSDVRPVLPPAPASPLAGEPIESQVIAEQPGKVESDVIAQPPVGYDRREGCLAGEGHRSEDLLDLVAQHELVLAEHIAALLELTVGEATGQLENLRGRGLVSRVRISGQSPAAFRITVEGAVQVDTALPRLRPVDPRSYRHAVAVVWLWAAGRRGNLGEVREVLTRRGMQAADATSRTGELVGRPGARFSDDGSDAADSDIDLAYPDLALLPVTGGWVRIDVVLGAPDPERLQTMITRAHRDRSLAGQLFMVDHDVQTRELIESIAAQLGLTDRVNVQWLAEDGIAGG